MQAKAMKILSGAVAAILASALAHAADDQGSVEERIKPIGTVVVASPAPAAPAEAAADESGAAAGTEAAAGAQSAASPAAAEGAAAAQAAGGAPEPPAAEAAGAAPAAGEDAQALAQASGCMACHQLDTKVVGPAFTEVAAKYEGDAAARDMLIEKVKNGGAGNWGQVPMPPNAHVGVTEIATLVDWILAL